MKIYMDVSVVLVYLFGKEKEKERYGPVVGVFNLLNSNRLSSVISIYSFQELYSFCQENFPPDAAPHVFRLSLLKLLDSPIEIVPLLTRQQRLIHEKKFQVGDPSDRPHVVSAYLSGCDAIVGYDEHFRDSSGFIRICLASEVRRYQREGQARA